MLVKHRAIGKGGQHVIERKLGDPLLALGNFPDHFIEAGGKPRKLILPPHAHVRMFATCEPTGGLIQSSQRSSNPASGSPGRK